MHLQPRAVHLGREGLRRPYAHEGERGVTSLLPHVQGPTPT